MPFIQGRACSSPSAAEVKARFPSLPERSPAPSGHTCRALGAWLARLHRLQLLAIDVIPPRSGDHVPFHLRVTVARVGKSAAGGDTATANDPVAIVRCGGFACCGWVDRSQGAA